MIKKNVVESVKTTIQTIKQTRYKFDEFVNEKKNDDVMIFALDHVSISTIEFSNASVETIDETNVENVEFEDDNDKFIDSYCYIFC